MELKTYFALDGNARVIPFVNFYVYYAGTEDLATGLEDENGNPLGNPFSSGATGKVFVAAPNGNYDIKSVKGGVEYTERVQFNDVSDSVAAAEDAADRAAQSAEDADEFSQLTEADREATGLDRIATAGDRIATGLDREAAELAKDEAIAAASVSGDVVFVETFADAEGRLPLPDGTAVEVSQDENYDGDRTRYIVASGALVFAVNLNQIKKDLVNATDPEKGAGMVAAPYGGRLSEALNSTSVRQFGGNSSENGTAAFLAAVSAAIEAGHKRVFIPFSSFTVNNNTDAMGCSVHGAGTVLTGKIIGASSLSNIIINGENSSARSWHPAKFYDLSNKLIRKISDNQYQVFVSKELKGYLLITMRNNQTTPADSLASSNSDITSLRVVSIVNVVDLLVGKLSGQGSSGAWAPTNLITGILEPFDSDTSHYKYMQGSGGVGNYYEIDVVIPADGKITVAFLRSPASSPNITVEVGGEIVDENTSLVSSTSNLEVREYNATPGPSVVKVTNNSPTGLVNLVGCYFSKMKDARPDLKYDTIGVYRNGAAYKNYIVSTSANDYAIRDRVSQTWGGSYHGGESNINSKILINGNDTSILSGSFEVCSSLSISSTFNIDWSPVGGPMLEARTKHNFNFGGYSFTSSFDGDINAESFFTTLYGVNREFLSVTSPVIKDLSTVSDLSRLYFGRQNTVTYENESTNQSVTITHSQFNNEDTEKGGAYIYKVDSEYNKYYYGPADRGNKIINGIHSVSIYSFS